MKRILLLNVVIANILLLCSCGRAEKASAKAGTETLNEPFPTETIVTITETVEPQFDPEKIDEILQGTWTYVDTNIGSTEICQFDNGAFSSTNILDAVPDKATQSTGNYTIYDGYISIYFFKTDYTNTINYSWIGEELVLHKYIDTGADKGNTRVYVKQDTVLPGVNPSPTTESTDYASNYSNITVGMRNALQSAENYLSIMPFSYSGLIEQLEYEGYSHNEAVYAVDFCGADWYEQAAWSAKNYLDIMSFSRNGLIEQLEFDGYTYEQAAYGVDKAY